AATGSSLGAVPVFPLLAALPSGPRVAWMPLLLAVPYLAGAFGGIVTVRVASAPSIEAAPLYGFVAGAAAGVAAGLAAAFSGGPLGNGRLAEVGPSGLDVGLVAVLQIGVTAALAAGAANWLILRRARRPRGREGAPRPPGATQIVDETDDVGGHRIYVSRSVPAGARASGEPPRGRSVPADQ
ncbi:MAG: hypothetical protein JO132_14965, partial [Streptosporangiaceae bacterium]|nr:hypothetical protein [Streptosporangiaceae bacterium]